MRDSDLEEDCGDYMNTALYKYFINILVAVVVGVINYFIRVTYSYLSGFERYKTITKQNDSLMKKQFISMFINIGILILLINANLQDSGVIKGIAEGLPGGDEFFFNGSYSDLNRNWYPKVAVAIIVLVITNLFSNVFSVIITELIKLVQRKFFAKRQTLQVDMNNCMAGGDFALSNKYALILSIVFVTIMYCGPIPLLLPI